MDESILLEIKKTEEKADSIIQESLAKKEKMLREAEAEAARAKEKEIARFRAEIERKAAAESDRIAGESSAIKGRALEQAKKLKVDEKKIREAKLLLEKELDAILQK